MNTEQSDDSDSSGRGRKFVFLRVHGLPGVFNVLLDSGAGISCVNEAIVLQYCLRVETPTHTENKIVLADKSTKDRTGVVRLRYDVLFPGGERGVITRQVHDFEVLPLSVDFLLGTDLIHDIWPDDDFLQYVRRRTFIATPHSSIPSSRTSSTAAPATPLPASMFSKRYRTALRHHGVQYGLPYRHKDRSPAIVAAAHAAYVRRGLDQLNLDMQTQRQSTPHDDHDDDMDVDDYVGSLRVTINNDSDEDDSRRAPSDAARHTMNRQVHRSREQEVARRRKIAGSLDDQDENLFWVQMIELGEITIGDHLTEDTVTLNDQTQDRNLSHDTDDVPTRPHSTTPAELEAQHGPLRATLMQQLQQILAENERLEGFCTHPDAVLKFTVAPENRSKLYHRQYPLAQALVEGAHEIVMRWLKTKRIQRTPVNTPYNSPILVAPKKDIHGNWTKLRVCLDVRVLNKHIIENDRFVLPFIPDVLASFKGGKLFGEFDLSEAYNQWRVDKDTAPYLSFMWNGEQYMFTAAPFGIKHMPSLFQRFIVRLFHDMPFVFPYIDNLPFASCNWEEHYEHARMIIERLTRWNLRIKPESVNLGNAEIHILGHVISGDGIRLDPKKVQTIMEWPKPATGTELQSFLGLGTFLRDHIRHYADITGPLEAVKRQKVIDWTLTLDRCWDLVKRAFSRAPFLKFPDFNRPFCIAHDASQTGVGGVLFQPDDDLLTITPFNIVAICSKKLTPTQMRYAVYKKELWGMIYCLNKFHIYIWGQKNVFVLTDHKPLVHILNQANLTVALQQWLDIILNYSLTIVYRPGILHVIPDALSRMYTSAYEDSNDVWGTHSNIKFVQSHSMNEINSPSDILVQQSIEAAAAPTNVKKRHAIPQSQGRRQGDEMLIQSICVCESEHYIFDCPSCYGFDEVCTVEAINSDDEDDFERSVQCGANEFASLHYRGAQLNNTDSVVYLTYQPDLVAAVEVVDDNKSLDDRATSVASSVTASVAMTPEEKLAYKLQMMGVKQPTSEAHKQELLEKAHLAGHFGRTAVVKDIRYQGYWWPTVAQDVLTHLQSCSRCMHHTILRDRFYVHRPVRSEMPGDHWVVDLGKMRPAATGETHLMVIQDVFTGFTILRALLNADAITVAKAFWDAICIFGPPKYIQSDRGTEFDNQIIDALFGCMGIEHRLISAYNPRANGRAERAVGVIKGMLIKHMHGAYVYWTHFLPFVQLTYNNKLRKLTGATPFSLMFGRDMNQFRDYVGEEVITPDLHDEQAWMSWRDRINSLIFPAIIYRTKLQDEKYINKMKGQRDVLLKESLPPGTMVMIKDPRYLKGKETVRPSHEPMYIGPYRIARRTQHGPYMLKDDTGELYPRAVPIDQIKALPRAKYSESSGQRKAEWEDTYIVNRILDHTYEDGQMWYCVEWKGWPIADATWVPDYNITDEALIVNYYDQLSQQKLQELIKAADRHEKVLHKAASTRSRHRQIKPHPPSRSSPSSSSSSSSSNASSAAATPSTSRSGRPVKPVQRTTVNAWFIELHRDTNDSGDDHEENNT